VKNEPDVQRAGSNDEVAWKHGPHPTLNIGAEATSPFATVDPPRLTRPRSRPPASSPPSALAADLVLAAADADKTSRTFHQLAALWRELLDRRLNVHGLGATAGPSGRTFVLLRPDAHPSARPGTLNRLEASVTTRILAGAQQKGLAFEFQIAPATISKWHTMARKKLALAEVPVPLPLVIAAQAWDSKCEPPADVRSATFEHQGGEYQLVSVPRGTAHDPGTLTPAQQEIALQIARGYSREQIAASRYTSLDTVACQMREINWRIRVSGRPALIARATELGWFR
jgi:DNA-binding CsgD family transcriptional regulator